MSTQQDENIQTSQPQVQQPQQAQADEPLDDYSASTVQLFSDEDTEEFRNRWAEIQRGFVDNPRNVVEDADRLVADLTQRITTQFGEERTLLEGQWDRDDDVSTEELRVALKRYRSFFERLLST
jgi:hypothetical protein